MNTKHKNYKDYLASNRRIEEIRCAKKALGYEPLDKPYQKGFNMYYHLRGDILRRDDSDILIYIVEKYCNPIYCKNGEFTYWDRDHRKYVDRLPGFKAIPEHIYNNYTPSVQKWFKHDPSSDIYNYWCGGLKRFYVVDIPDYFLIKKIENNWITHYKVVDEVLEQELSEVKHNISSLTNYRPWYSFSNKSAKPYRQFRNRQLRHNSKQDLNTAIKNGTLEDLNSIKRRRSILWDMY